jgi:hypothetical protein
MLSPDNKKAIEKVHQDACDAGKDTYIDPFSGYSVFTETYHKNRGFCCESGCRHCPYGFTPAPSRSLFGRKNRSE